MIYRAQKVAGVGGVDFIKRQQPHWSDNFRWRVSKRDDIVLVLLSIHRALGARRSAKVDEFFDWYQSKNQTFVLSAADPMPRTEAFLRRALAMEAPDEPEATPHREGFGGSVRIGGWLLCVRLRPMP